MPCSGILSLGTLILIAWPSAASGQSALPDFSDLSLDQLSNIKITSFTKKEQKLSQVAGAVYVITQDQIARSGLTSVPELLRLAPGIDVARVNGDQWSISARGQIGAYANKLLVLIDGRSIYSAIFSGVYWEMGMPLLDDIERIEVIRGPGATIWGANAVLGVINIITKNSQDTHGTLVTAGGGTSEHGFGSVRTGGTIGSTNYRAYVGGSGNAPLRQADGTDANDGRSSVQTGFRLDGSHKQDAWMLEGDLSWGEENNTGVYVSLPTLSLIHAAAHFDTFAGNLTGEWRHPVGKTGELRVQSYYDVADRPQPQASKVETRTWDTQVQYDFKLGNIHNFSVGGGERLISENVVATGTVTFSTTALTYSNLNVFAQDEMHFMHDTLLFTAGAKLEHNQFGGWGVEPSANLLWMPNKINSLWISSARSLRTASLYDVSVTGLFDVVPPSAATGGLTVLDYFVPSPAFLSEVVTDFEVGHRAQLTKKLSVDVSLFYDRYSRLQSYTADAPTFGLAPAPHLDVTATAANNIAGTGKGAESSISWQVLPSWKLEGSYTHDEVNTWFTASAPAGSVEVTKQPSRNKWRLQSYVNLSKHWQADAFLYWTSAASPTNSYGPNIPVPSYTRLDVRLGYKAGQHWQLSLVGQNLLDARHLEAVSALLSLQSYVTREVYMKSTWQF
jgi:iron complex outermembrane receptor protein